MNEATYTSAMGRQVRVEKFDTPDDPCDTKQLWVRYHQGGKGREIFYPDTPRFWPKAQEVVELYRQDIDDLGTPFKSQSETQRKASLEHLEAARARRAGK